MPGDGEDVELDDTSSSSQESAEQESPQLKEPVSLVSGDIFLLGGGHILQS